jgi:putative glutamine amidotransferase
VVILARLLSGGAVVMSAARPVVGIICCNRSYGTETAQSVMNRYAVACMRYANVSALLIPALPDLVSAPDVIARLDGVMLTGAPSNVEPARYGDDDAGDGPFDAARDTMMLRIVETVRGRKPLFGVCRGFQEINVAYGGSLRRDTSADHARLKHHAPKDVGFDAMFDHHHDVQLRDGGVLARAFGVASLPVNSVHFQGVGRLGDGLQVEATAPDGLIEAVSGTENGAPVLAVQWHPEWQADQHDQSQIFFALFGRAVRGQSL